MYNIVAPRRHFRVVLHSLADFFVQFTSMILLTFSGKWDGLWLNKLDSIFAILNTFVLLRVVSITIFKRQPNYSHVNDLLTGAVRKRDSMVWLHCQRTDQEQKLRDMLHRRKTGQWFERTTSRRRKRPVVWPAGQLRVQVQTYLFRKANQNDTDEERSLSLRCRRPRLSHIRRIETPTEAIHWNNRSISSLMVHAFTLFSANLACGVIWTFGAYLHEEQGQLLSTLIAA